MNEEFAKLMRGKVNWTGSWDESANNGEFESYIDTLGKLLGLTFTYGVNSPYYDGCQRGVCILTDKIKLGVKLIDEYKNLDNLNEIVTYHEVNVLFPDEWNFVENGHVLLKVAAIPGVYTFNERPPKIRDKDSQIECYNGLERLIDKSKETLIGHLTRIYKGETVPVSRSYEPKGVGYNIDNSAAFILALLTFKEGLK